ncbi:MAG: hypothetical protein JO147_11490 [Actinobacteria bacterium]|nr:hypothetical protein [Actinomycetota bacterium]
MGNDLSAMVTALIVVAALGLLVRWVFKPSHRTELSSLVDASDSAELGLLDVVASRLPRAAALRVRATLGEAGIRSSLSRRRDGELDVLVFRVDAERARNVLTYPG